MFTSYYNLQLAGKDFHIVEWETHTWLLKISSEEKTKDLVRQQVSP